MAKKNKNEPANGLTKKPVYPFSAIAGQQELKTCLILKCKMISDILVDRYAISLATVW